MELEAQRLRAEELGGAGYLEHRDNARYGIWRAAVIYVPSGLILTGLLGVALLNLPNSIIAAVVLGIFALPVDLEALQAVRDLLRREPVTSRGVIDRQWAKSRFMFLGRVRYLLVELRRVDPSTGAVVDPDGKKKSALFEVEELTNQQLQPGDEIEVVHWPHTNAIVSLELVSSGVDANKGSKPPGRPNKAWEELDRGPSGNTNPWTGL